MIEIALIALCGLFAAFAGFVTWTSTRQVRQAREDGFLMGSKRIEELEKSEAYLRHTLSAFLETQRLSLDRIAKQRDENNETPAAVGVPRPMPETANGEAQLGILPSVRLR